MAVAAAIALDAPFFQTGSKVVLVVVFLGIASPVLSHATARAARIRQFGHWVIQPDEKEMVARESSTAPSQPDRRKKP
jgi:multisubunit Na+/H+ antiporter MnhG subunit